MRSQERRLRWVAALEKAKFLRKWVKIFGGFIKSVQERREIYTLATNCSISMGFLEIVGRRRHLKPLIFNLINGAVGEVAVCLSN